MLSTPASPGSVRQVIACGRAANSGFGMPNGRHSSVAAGIGQDAEGPVSGAHPLDDRDDRGTVWLRPSPDTLSAKNLSFAV